MDGCGLDGGLALRNAPTGQAFTAKPARFLKGTVPPSHLLESLLLSMLERARMVSSTYSMQTLNVSNNKFGNAVWPNWPAQLVLTAPDLTQNCMASLADGCQEPSRAPGTAFLTVTP